MLLTTAIALAGFASVQASPLLKRQQNRQYPDQSAVGPAPLPAWIDTYNAAKAAGKLGPASWQPAQMGNINPYYTGIDPSAKGICSWTLTECFAPDDIHAGPAGTWGLAFDDGPTYASPQLYSFLQSQNQSATHFMIGGNILGNPDIFQQAIATGGQISGHTWSHPYMTTMTDMQVLGELGWTSQIIYDQSGLVPSFWRPPYGDVDNRVRAIAKEVFGLTTVIWDEDSADWCLTEGGGSSCGGAGPQTDAQLDAEFQGWAAAPKSTGLVILQHERTTRSVGSFLRTYGTIKGAGWNVMPIPELYGDDWYLNAASNTSPKQDGVGIGEGIAADAGTNSSAVPSSISSVLPSSSMPVNSTMMTSTTSASSSATPSSSALASSASSASLITSASSSTPTSNAAASQRPTSAGVKATAGWTVSALAAVVGIACTVL